MPQYEGSGNVNRLLSFFSRDQQAAAAKRQSAAPRDPSSLAIDNGLDGAARDPGDTVGRPNDNDKLLPRRLQTRRDKSGPRTDIDDRTVRRMARYSHGNTAITVSKPKRISLDIMEMRKAALGVSDF
jgi:hypothetical protein